ncbi:MAG: hypothetical protein KDH09_04945, partial [Chrysiogenetes bacterium]|nr:hypothetical protein [Chrysiogenetes bacterium]
VADAVKALGPWISDWEILNETNTPRFWIRTPSAREYMDLLVPTGKLIRSLAPGARVMLGSLCGNDVSYLAPVVRRHYLRELLALGAMEHADLVGFHPYTGDCYVSLKGEGGTARGVEQGIARFFDAYPELADRTWITEIGISRGLVRLGHREIGRVYARWIRGAAERGVPVYLWCLQDFDDPEYGPLNPERTFGLAGVDLRINETGLALIEALGLSS